VCERRGECHPVLQESIRSKDIMRMPGPAHSISHAEIQIEDSRIMLANEHPDMNYRRPHSFGGAAVHIRLYVQDVDRVVRRRSPPASNCCGP